MFAETPKFNEDGTTIGSILKRIRKAKGITLRQIEKATGISNSYLSQLENGKVLKPSYDTVMKLNRFIAELPEKKAACPLCNSGDIKDVSVMERHQFTMNTPIGTRLPPRAKIFDAMCCNNCGILFRINKQ